LRCITAVRVCVTFLPFAFYYITLLPAIALPLLTLYMDAALSHDRLRGTRHPVSTASSSSYVSPPLPRHQLRHWRSPAGQSRPYRQHSGALGIWRRQRLCRHFARLGGNPTRVASGLSTPVWYGRGGGITTADELPYGVCCGRAGVFFALAQDQTPLTQNLRILISRGAASKPLPRTRDISASWPRYRTMREGRRALSPAGSLPAPRKKQTTTTLRTSLPRRRARRAEDK